MAKKKIYFKPQPKKKKNKYNAQSATYGGYTYHSKKEKDYAVQLDWRIKAKEVKSYTRQHRLDLRVNGILICKYFIDFRVELTDGTIEYVEVKGFETDLWRLKWKLTKATFQQMTEGEKAKLVLVK
jgi:hypothetical protein